MILNEKCNITAPSKSKYKITDIFKNTDGSINSYQVEISRQPGKALCLSPTISMLHISI